MKPSQRNIIFLCVGLMIANAVVWHGAWSLRASEVPEIYMLDVGQGDSALIILPGDIHVLVDGGPAGAKAAEALGNILPFWNRRIDIILLTHPELDHFGGLIEVIKRHDVGIVLWNGREGSASAYSDFTRAIEKKKVKTLIVGEGDVIRYRENTFSLVWPSDVARAGKSTNESSIVFLLRAKNGSALFTGDIGAVSEKDLAHRYDLRADILKVPHHGSKYSSSDIFLDVVQPKIALIGVGKNSYGHPTKEVLARLASHGARIFRTDLNGTIRVVLQKEKMSVFVEK